LVLLLVNNGVGTPLAFRTAATREPARLAQ